MSSKPSIDSFGDLISALTKELPYQQMRFNYDYGDRLVAFKPLFEAATAMGLRELALALAPRASSLDEIDTGAGFRFASLREQQTSLRVQPLGLGFSRRYAYAESVQNRVRVLVRKLPAEPGKNISEKPHS